MFNMKAIACVLAAIVCGFLTIACAYMAYDAFAHMDFMFGPVFVAAAAGSACMLWVFSDTMHSDIYSTAYDEGWDDGWAQRDEEHKEAFSRHIVYAKDVMPLVKLGQGDYERCDKDILVPPVVPIHDSVTRDREWPDDEPLGTKRSEQAGTQNLPIEFDFDNPFKDA